MKTLRAKKSDTEGIERILRRALLCLSSGKRKPIRETVGFSPHTNGIRVGVYYLPDALMRHLALRFLNERKKDIDVLAFPETKHFPHPEAKAGRMLGDIYLREGLKTKPLSLRGFFVIHGLLHLLGYTHDKKRDTMVMEDRERLLFRKIFPHTPHPWPRTTTPASSKISLKLGINFRSRSRKKRSRR